jgi:two-component system NarL family response regulator
VSPITVLVHSDQRMFGSTLAASLEDGGHQVCTVVERREELLRAVRTTAPDVCALDVRAGQAAGVELCAAVRQACPDTHVLILTTADEPEVWQAYDAGLVDAVVSKVHGLTTVRAAIARAAAGERFALASSRPPAVSRMPQTSLTAREREILLLLARGATTQQIRTTLRISANTLRTHIQHLLIKLHAHTRAQAVQAALAGGLAPDLDEDVS